MDDLAVEIIMVRWLRAPKYIMNMGLACRRWRQIAHRILLEMPEARNVNTLIEAYKLGWPCVIEKQLASSEIASFPCMDMIGACVGKNKNQLRHIYGMDRRRVFSFVMATQDRLGINSPVHMISHWIIETISHLVVGETKNY